VAGNESTEAGILFGTRRCQVLFTETSNTRLTEGALRSRSLQCACFSALAPTGKTLPGSKRDVLDGASCSAQ
jgi:hypothetical protein